MSLHSNMNEMRKIAELRDKKIAELQDKMAKAYEAHSKWRDEAISRIENRRKGALALERQRESAIAAADAARAEADALRADAGRFRWMLDGHGYIMEELSLCGHPPCSEEEKNKARKEIDEMMAAYPKAKS